MGLAEDFELAAQAAKELPKGVTNEDMLRLYALYKQATVGDCDTGASKDTCFFTRQRAF
jgi:diazepam-binding inhibitor (GABA receptor modulating acyl-CoA-binding protein)